MKNLNPYFNGKKYIETDLFAYIDESGTDCFGNKVLPQENWFVVSAITLNFDLSNKMLQKIIEYKEQNKPKTDLHNLTLKNLRNHNQRLNLLANLSKFNYLTTHSAFFKSKINPKDYSYPTAYFVCLKNTIERLSWITSQFKKNKIHIFISKRNQINSSEFSKYLFFYSVRAKRNLMYTNKLGFIGFAEPNNNPKLLLADYAAFSMRYCLEKRTEIGFCDTSYFDIFLKGKLYYSTHKKFSGIWNNGFKCTPDDKSLISHDGILEEGAHKL